MKSIRIHFTRLFLFLAIPFLFSFFVAPNAGATVGINRQINFQGKVVNKTAGTNVSNGSYDFIFRIYDAASNGNLIWTEKFDAGHSNALTVTDGIFRVALGSVCTFSGGSCQGTTNSAVDFNTDNLYLDINFNGESMGTRIQMAAVPYALNAEKVSGLTVTNNGGNTLNIGANLTLAVSTASKTLTGAGTQLSIANNLTFGSGTTGTVTLGSSTNSLALATTTDTSVTLPASGTLLTNTAASNQTITSTQTTGTLFSLSDSAGLTGSITGGSIGLTSSTNSQNKTGLSFDLSGGTGGTYYDLVGTGSTWSITRAGALTVASCSGCGAGGGTNYWNEVTGNGVSTGGYVVPFNLTTDFFIGGNATTSAKFSILNVLTGTPVASIAGHLTVGQGSQVRSQYGSLNLAYKSGANAWTNGLSLEDITGRVIVPVGVAVGTNPASAGVLRMPNASYITARNAANSADINMIQIDSSNLVAFGANLAAHTLGGTITANSQNISGAGTVTASVLGLGTNPAAAGTLRLPNATYITTRNAANSADINMIQIDSSNLVAFGVNLAAHTLGGAITGNSQNITGLGSLTVNGGGTIDSATSGTLSIASTTNTTSLVLGNSGATSGMTFNIDTAANYTFQKEGAAFACSGTDKLTLNGSGQMICGTDQTGGGSSVNYLGQNNGVTFIGNTTTDFAIGGTSTSTAKFVFGGSNSGVPTATFSGDLIIGERPNTPASDVQKWTKITGASGTIGGGTAAVASVSASVVYNGSLYVGTNNVNSAEVYRYDGDSLGTWTKVSGTAGTVGGGATTGIDTIASMIVYNGYLYVGTYEPDKAEVYRYDGSSTWTKVSGAAGTILTTATIDGVSAMAVFGGRLFIGTSEATKAEVYMYNGGTTWIAVNGTAGTLVGTNTVTQDAITSMVVINNQLIVGTKDATDADVVRWNGIVGGSPFFALNLASTTGSYLIDNAAQTGYLEVSAMTVWNGKLIVALRRGASLADILMYQEPPGGAAPINSWTRLNSAAGTIVAAGTANIDGVTAFAVYNGRLYAGTNEPGAAEIYRYEGEKNWNKISQNTAGQLSSGGTTAIDAISTLMAFNHNSLFAGTMETGKAEGYVFSSVIDQSYSLRFNAGASQAGGEQNNNQNLASIFFVASLSANINNKSGNTGSFVFTHGITTNNGSYDVAEDYPTRDESLEPGDVVSIDTNEREFVKKSEGDYDYTAIGVYSEKPALRLSQDFKEINGGRSIPVALVGRVPVKVNTENGEIKKGDPLTPSSTPGVAMKAKKSGLIIGLAMEDYSEAGIGRIVAYIKSSSYNGSIAESFTNIDQNSEEFPSSILAKILENKSNGKSSIITDTLIAGLKVITPNITADTIFAKNIKAEHIEGLDLLTSRIEELDQQVASIGASQKPKDDRLRLLEHLITEEQNGSSKAATVSQNALSLISLSVEGLASISGDLRVKNNSLFEGILTVLDNLTTNNFIVNGFSTFFGDVVYKAKVAFEGPVIFATDSGGMAQIKKDSDRVDIVFEKEFENSPILNASVVFDEKKDDKGNITPTDELEKKFFEEGYSYILVNKSQKGFTIVLNKKAIEDVYFTWTALQTKNPKTYQSRGPSE